MYNVVQIKQCGAPYVPMYDMSISRTWCTVYNGAPGCACTVVHMHPVFRLLAVWLQGETHTYISYCAIALLSSSFNALLLRPSMLRSIKKGSPV